MDPKSIFYVYVLFDYLGIPRYVGKGRGSRWKQHETQKRMMKTFVAQTILLLGEVPKIKIRENLTEHEAYTIEHAFIKAIGREPFGTLVNRTDRGSGPNSDSVKAWHASRTPEQKAATARKTQETIAQKYTPEQRSERGRTNAIKVGTQALSERMAAWQALRSQDERRIAASNAGKISSEVRPIEEKRSRALNMVAAYMASTTKQQRQENAKKTGLAKLTKEQLSANGRKGVATANGNRTPEQRSALGRKARLAQLQAKNN